MLTVKENPIEEDFLSLSNNTQNRILVVVPFLSPYVKKMFGSEKIGLVKDKRMIVRLDQSSVTSFDLNAMKYLLDIGFELVYENSVHMKLYLFDDKAIVSSGNFTQGGLVNNLELSVFCDLKEYDFVGLFNRLWNKYKHQEITKNYTEENWGVYLSLKSKKEAGITKPNPIPKPVTEIIGTLNIQDLKRKIFYENLEIYSGKSESIIKANIAREEIITRLKAGFKKEIFYADKTNDTDRFQSFFYQIIYNHEYDLAGTGLREGQIRSICLHEDFKKVIAFVYPNAFGNSAGWDLNDESQYQKFCNDIFQFRHIPNYKETFPIRLASYFYPEHFIHIFKLDHLKNICSSLGYSVTSDSEGEQLFEYNRILIEELKNVPGSNYVKSTMLYYYHYTVRLYNAISEGQSTKEFAESEGHNKKWIENIIQRGETILREIKAI